MTQILHGTAKLSIHSWKLWLFQAERCTTMRQLKALQAALTVHGFHRNSYALSKLIAFCALSPHGNLSYASLLFNQIEMPNLFIYNTLIRAYSRSSQPRLALHYFDIMLRDGNVRPQNHTFHFVLFACANACWNLLGRQIHCWVLKNGIILADGHIQTAVIRLYAGCNLMNDARKTFDEIPLPDVVQWNVLMSGYARCNLASEALNAFRYMFVMGVEPDKFCVTTALMACAQSGALVQGKWIHEYIKKKSLEFDVFVGTALVDMYAKCGCLYMAVEVFEGMPKRNAFSWAAMIGGFAMHGHAREAIHCLERMQVEDRLKPDGVVLLGVLMACTHAGLQEEGLFLLDNMKARYGIMPRHEHYSCVVDLLCRAARWDEALALIKRMPMKPLASVWGAVLSSCRTHKNVELAELAVKELVKLDNGDITEEAAALVQLTNIYLSAEKGEGACTLRRTFGERRMNKPPGCSVIEVNGISNEFVSGDVSHKDLPQMLAILELLLPDLIVG